jgi:hypothetical protein
MFERLRHAPRAPLGDEATLREMVQIATANAAAHLDLISPPCDECLDKLDAYLAQGRTGVTLGSSAAALH